MYNDNKYFHGILCYYIRRYIIINIYVIYESVFLLYKKMYNDNKYFSYT